MVDRERKKNIKEVISSVKLVYKSCVVLRNGYIMGVPVKNNPRVSFYKSDFIAGDFPELTNMNLILKEDLYTNREEFRLINDNLVINPVAKKVEECEPNIVANKVSSSVLDKFNKYIEFILPLFESILDSDERIFYRFTEDEIDKMIKYTAIKVCFPVKGYEMFVAVSMFPVINKLRNLVAYSVETDTNYFDTVFKAYNEKESFYIIYRFLKL